jgi:RNA polymerase sigma factor (sigma-70 family)
MSESDRKTSDQKTRSTACEGLPTDNLLSAYRPLLNSLTNRLAGPDWAGHAAEDLAQTGAMALILAAGDVSPQNAAFPKYARLRVEGAMRDARRRTAGRAGKARPMAESFDVAVIEALPDEASDPYEVLENNALFAAIGKAVDLLPSRQKAILKLSFERSMTMEDIAEMLSLSVSQVGRLRSDALAALRVRLACWQD